MTLSASKSSGGLVGLRTNRKRLPIGRKPRIALVVCPYEGEVRDRVTHEFYKPGQVKYMPLGLLSLAAGLSEYEVKVIDSSSRGLSVEATLEEIEAFNPDILGLSVVTYRAWAMRELLRRSSAPIKVVGGPHTTTRSQHVRNQGAHAVFVGDAEHTFPQWIKDGCPDGIFSSEPTDLNTIPMPARHLVNLDDYRIRGDRSKLLFDAGSLRLPMYSSKGCPLKCNYCDVQQKKHIMKDPELIVEEFKSILGLGATSVHVLDDAFNIRKDRVQQLCRLIIDSQLEIDWSVRGVVEIREEVVRLLAEAGCRRWHVGIEHLDDDVLTYFRKSQRYKHVEKFCELTAKYGIQLIAYFIMGAPKETPAYRDRLPSMIENLGIKIPYFNVLTPLSDTDYYDELRKNGTFERDFWEEFAADPSRDFEIPSHRTASEEDDLKQLLRSYIEHFHRVKVA